MIDLNVVDLIIFDCDGVLIDSEVLLCEIDRQALLSLGCRLTTDELFRRFGGVPYREMWAEIQREWGVTLPPDFDRQHKQRVDDAFRSSLQAIPGMAALLSQLTTPICVASSSAPGKIRLGLEITGLLQPFNSHLFSAAMVDHGKPAPDLFLFAARQMGVHPSRCVVVEDSVSGVRAGSAARMQVIGFTGGGHCPPGHADILRREGADDTAENTETLRRLLIGPNR